MESNCVFCKILAGEIPCCKVYEDDKVLAFLDIAPFNFGHTVIIPKEHFAAMTVTPDEYLSAMICAASKIAPAVMRATKAGGFNLLNNNGSVAGQTVQHVHFHIIPRFVDDGVVMSAQPRAYGDGEMAALAQEISGKISQKSDV